MEKVLQPERQPEKIPERQPERQPERLPERQPEKVPEKVAEKTPQPEKTPEPIKVPEPLPEPEKIPERQPEKPPDKVPDKVTIEEVKTTKPFVYATLPAEALDQKGKVKKGTVCFPVGTKVLVQNEKPKKQTRYWDRVQPCHTVKIEDIKVGDVVLSYNSVTAKKE